MPISSCQHTAWNKEILVHRTRTSVVVGLRLLGVVVLLLGRGMLLRMRLLHSSLRVSRCRILSNLGVFFDVCLD